MIVSASVLEEYEKVLRQPRFKLDSPHIAAVLSLIRENGLLVHPTVPATAARNDESGNRFLECAGAGQVDYIITGNTKHFPEAFWALPRGHSKAIH